MALHILAFALTLLALSSALHLARPMGVPLHHSSQELFSNASPRASVERTYVMVKPDGVKRKLVGEIISRFERKGLRLAELRMVMPTREILEEHYVEHKEKAFFPKLMAFMTSGPVVAMVWEGVNAVAAARTMLGSTYPSEAAPGTIRGDFGLLPSRNLCHASDSISSANREISIWFNGGTLPLPSESDGWFEEL